MQGKDRAKEHRQRSEGSRPAANVESCASGGEGGSRGDPGTYSAMLPLNILKAEPSIFALENVGRLITRKTKMVSKL